MTADPSTLAGELSDEERAKAVALARCDRRDLRYLVACGRVTLSNSMTLVSRDPEANEHRRRMDALVMLGLAHTHRKASRGRITYEPTPLGLAVAKHLERDNG